MGKGRSSLPVEDVIQAKMIHLGNEKIIIPKTMLADEFLVTQYPNCPKVAHELKRVFHVQTYSDLPDQFDGIDRALMGVGQKTVEKFWSELKSYIEENEGPNAYRKGCHLVYENMVFEISENIKNESLTWLQKDQRVNGTIEKLLRAGMNTFSDLPVHLEEIRRIDGIGETKVKKLFQVIMSDASDIENIIKKQKFLQTLTDLEKQSYYLEQFVDSTSSLFENIEFQKVLKLSHRELEVLAYKFEKFKQGKVLTLEKIGEHFHLTRERIRQILKKSSHKIEPYFRELFTLLRSYIGEQQMVTLLDNNERTILPIFILSEVLGHDHIYYDIQSNTFSVWSITELDEKRSAVKAVVKERWSRKLVTDFDVESFVENACFDLHMNKSLLKQLVFEMLRTVSPHTFIVKNLNKADLVAIVMKDFPDGIAINKKADVLFHKANRLLPGAFERERDVTSIFARDTYHNDYFLWGRGMYIHQCFVKVPQGLINDIIQYTDHHLMQHRMITAKKLFDVFREEMSQTHIPNEYALFSMMRYVHHQKPEDLQTLGFNKYLVISNKGDDITALDPLLIDFVKEQHRAVSVAEMKQYFVQQIGWNSYTIDSILSHSESLIQVDFGLYEPIEYLKSYSKEKMQPMMLAIHRLLKDETCIHVKGVYQDFESYCKSIGIHSSYLLYSLLEFYFSDELQLPRYPHIVRLGEDISDLSIATIIEDYVLSYGDIITREQLVKYIVEDKKMQPNKIDVALSNSDNMLIYTAGPFGEYVHKKVIGWNDEKAKQLDKLIINVIKEHEKTTRKPYYVLDDQTLELPLPALDNKINWSLDLLSELLQKNQRDFLFIGSKRRILLLQSNHAHITSATDFIAYLIKDEFNGTVKNHTLMKTLQALTYSAHGTVLKEVEGHMESGQAPFERIGDVWVLKKQK